MRYFDAAGYTADQSLAKRLGYAKVLSNDELALQRAPGSKGARYILNSADPGQVHRALKDPHCLGLALHDNTLVKKSIEQLKDNEKFLFLIASELTNPASGSPVRALGRARHLLLFARKAGARVALVSIAKDASELLSSTQMLGLARLLGAEEGYAKQMLSSWWSE